MKIVFDLKKEKESIPDLIKQALGDDKSFNFMNIFDKAGFIEALWLSLKQNQTVRIKIDEHKKDYPTILDNVPPRIIVQEEDNKIIDFAYYIKKRKTKGFDIDIEQKNEDYFLKITKNKEEKLDLGLKIDRNKTIDLSLMFENIRGIKSYYYKNRKN